MSVADKLQTIQNIKENIKTAINNKGGNVGDDFTQYSAAIDGLSTGGGITKIDVAEAGIKFSRSSFATLPEWADFSNVTDMSYMFQYCSNLPTISLLDTSNVTDMSFMFSNCYDLTTIPELDTSNVTNMERMFYSCDNLTTLPELDVSKVTNIKDYFRNGGNKLTDVGGWKNLKIDWNDNYGLVLYPNLTYQSCINVLNGLWDFRGNGDATTTRTLKVHQNFLNLVGDEISIGTNKGWIITA